MADSTRNNSEEFSSENLPTDESSSDFKSKTQIKKEFKALQELGRELVDLPSKQLGLLPLSDAMAELILAAQAMQRGTFNRQLRLIGSRMVDEDVEGIQKQLNLLKLPQRQSVNAFHQVEEWRDGLIAGNNDVFNELAERHSEFDRQYVSQLVRNANKEEQQNKPPKAARLLFQYLKDLSQT